MVFTSLDAHNSCGREVRPRSKSEGGPAAEEVVKRVSKFLFDSAGPSRDHFPEAAVKKASSKQRRPRLNTEEALEDVLGGAQAQKGAGQQLVDTKHLLSSSSAASSGSAASSPLPSPPWTTTPPNPPMVTEEPPPLELGNAVEWPELEPASRILYPAVPRAVDVRRMQENTTLKEWDDLEHDWEMLNDKDHDGADWIDVDPRPKPTTFKEAVLHRDPYGLSKAPHLSMGVHSAPHRAGRTAANSANNANASSSSKATQQPPSKQLCYSDDLLMSEAASCVGAADLEYSRRTRRSHQSKLSRDKRLAALAAA